jgi:hypothetical protein
MSAKRILRNQSKTMNDAADFWRHIIGVGQRQRIATIEQDKLNRQTPFNPQKQFYPADLFILVGFDFKGRPILERNPRWHTKDGFYSGRSA